MKHTGVFIQKLDGSLCEVIDLQKGIEQAKQAVSWHDERKDIDLHGTPEERRNMFYFGEAHREWNYTLLELQKIEMKLSGKLLNQTNNNH